MAVRIHHIAAFLAVGTEFAVRKLEIRLPHQPDFGWRKILRRIRSIVSLIEQRHAEYLQRPAHSRRNRYAAGGSIDQIIGTGKRKPAIGDIPFGGFAHEPFIVGPIGRRRTDGDFSGGEIIVQIVINRPGIFLPVVFFGRFRIPAVIGRSTDGLQRADVMIPEWKKIIIRFVTGKRQPQLFEIAQTTALA